MSVDLDFRSAPDDLMTKFIDCLVLLPNLKTLEVLRTYFADPFLRKLGQECPRFPSVRELVVVNAASTLVGRCPNVESVVVADGLSLNGAVALNLYGEGLEKLKHFAGVSVSGVELGELRGTYWSEAYIHRRCITTVVQCCPNLEEIHIWGEIGLSGGPSVSSCAEDLRGPHQYRL